MNPREQRILILDFGGQYTQLIARAVRELGVYCEIFAHDCAARAIETFAPKGIILSGGPASAHVARAPIAPPMIFNLQTPLLGICYGMQTMIAQLGGRVVNAARHEYGGARVQTLRDSRLSGEAGRDLSVWMSHGDSVAELAAGFCSVGASDNAPYAIVADESRRFYGVQFHPEVTHTPDGRRMLSRFVHDICGCEDQWRPAAIVESLVDEIRDEVGDAHVIVGLSGGVDSAVTAALLARAVGAQLTCIFVDTGLLRQGEGDQVMQTFAAHFDSRVIRVDAADEFFRALAGVTAPEQKRKIIGNLFVEIFQREAGKIKNAKYLAQGTIYPDVIESAGHAHAKAGAKVIKSHHNVGGLPAKMNLRLLEPLRELFKDEVRRIGGEIGLPAAMLKRHPFPGPGLGVRILGEVKKEYADILRQADAIFLQELARHNLLDEIAQAFAVFLPVKSVGVVGDNRAYSNVIALRAVETHDFMTANWKPIPHHVLAEISSRILNEVRGVGRVTYDISNKPPATIEWE